MFDNNDKNRFIISGIVENEEIEDDDIDENQNPLERLFGQEGPSVSFKFPKDIDDEILDFFKNAFGLGLSQEEQDEDDEDLFEGAFPMDDSPEEDVEISQILTGDVFGKIVFEPSYKDIKDIFEDTYGVKNVYDNLVGDFEILKDIQIKEFKYIKNSENYILLEGTVEDSSKKPILVALFLTEDEELSMIIPTYGNSFDVETGDFLNREYDLKKVQTEVELMLYREHYPITSINDFGTVIPDMYFEPNERGDSIYIGKIRDNDTELSRIFRHDFDLNEDLKTFNFFVKINREGSWRTLQIIRKFLMGIDFNTNPKIQTYELQVDKKGDLFIEIDLGDFPENAVDWDQ